MAKQTVTASVNYRADLHAQEIIMEGPKGRVVCYRMLAFRKEPKEITAANISRLYKRLANQANVHDLAFERGC